MSQKEAVMNKCDVCQVPENVEHVVMKCRKYDVECSELHSRIFKLTRAGVWKAF